MELSELLERLNNLKRMPRTGWLLCNVPLNEAEDVAQHTFEVAALTFLLSEELRRRGQKFNAERALGMAIVHDWAEATVADFPYTALKYLGPKGAKERMEGQAMEDLLAGLPGEGKCMELWQEYAEKRSLEAKIVHAADYLSMLIQAIKYRERGNRSKELDELWRAVHADIEPYAAEIEVVKELVEELDGRYSEFSP
ncbi:MAG: HD domain-containing protein [Candidatus Hodarchaeaceae archaeon]|nr:HD domain-containing protein [Candidatus Hodarchaeaceae archaeon]